MQYYIDIKHKNKNTADEKAPKDISELCKQEGMKSFSMPSLPTERGNIYLKIWLMFVCPFYWIKLWRIVKNGDVVIYQHPMYGNRVAAFFIPVIQKHKHCKFIAVIHDLESLRKGVEGAYKPNSKTSEISDNKLLKEFNAIICHNSHMKQYLVSQGFNSKKIVCLGIFDYLCNCKVNDNSKGRDPSIAIAGNLAAGKCAYIYNILNTSNKGNSNLTIHLYGKNFNRDQGENRMIYHGSYSPEELPMLLEGDFGLVWDGTSAKTCEGNTGEYLRYNNPHKTSLYLASNKPVIVWRQAAIADFILEHEVGIVVDNLDDLGEIISNMSDEEYTIMCDNASKIGERVRTGWYFLTALKKSLNIIENT